MVYANESCGEHATYFRRWLKWRAMPAAILLLRTWHVYFLLELNFVEKVVLNESMAAKMGSPVSYLVYYDCI